MAGSDGLDLALGAGAAGFEFAAGVGSMYTGSGLFWGWAVAVGFNSMGIGRRTFFLGSSTAFVSMPSSVIKGRISSFFSLGKTTAHVSEDSNNPSDIPIKSSMSP